MVHFLAVKDKTDLESVQRSATKAIFTEQNRMEEIM